MSLSNSVRTHLIDPTIHNSQRTRFSLPDAFWSSTLKLVDLGTFAGTQTNETGFFYPTITGIIAAIRRLTLYSNDFKIDSIEELKAYASIKHLRTTNQSSEDVHRFELLNGMGLSIASKKDAPLGQDVQAGSYTLNRKNKDYANHYEQAGAPTGDWEHNLLNNQIKMSASEDEQSGCLLLSEYLEFLRSVPVLPMIPNLQLEIEWDYKVANFVNDPDAPADIGLPSIFNMRPTLVCDEILGVKPEMANTKIPYFCTLVERFAIPSTTNGTAQSSTFRSQAFSGRYLKDLILFNQVSSDDGFLKGFERSPVMYKEKIQLVVNGTKYLPDQGISQPAMKLQYFNDTFSPLNIPYASLVQALIDASGNVLSKDDRDTASYSTSALTHNYSVAGIGIEAPIDRLDIEYQRTGNNLRGSNQARIDNVAAFKLLAFGRIAKQLTIQNGKIIDSY